MPIGIKERVRIEEWWKSCKTEQLWGSPWEKEGCGNANTRCDCDHIGDDNIGLDENDHYHEGHRPL